MFLRKVQAEAERWYSSNRRMVLGLCATAVLLLLVGIGVAIQLSRSDWAAWVQAFGSIAAVLSAVFLVQYQHKKELATAAEDRRQQRLARLYALRNILGVVMNAARATSEKINSEHVRWDHEADRVADALNLVRSVPLLDLPDHALIIRFADLANSLITSKVLAFEMQHPRPPETRLRIGQTIERSARIAANAMVDVTTLIAESSTPTEMARQWRLLDQQRENDDLAASIWNREVVKRSTRSGGRGSETTSPSPNG